MTLIDTHAHLLHRRYAEEQGPSAQQLIENATASGVAHTICIACERNEWMPYQQLAAANPAHISLSVGIHPMSAGQGGVVQASELEPLLSNPRVVALGETGLDYFYDKASKADQHASFRTHLQLAVKHDLPVVIHTRDAEADTLSILKEFPTARFVLHCFTGTRELAEGAVRAGGYISFSGILTFKKSNDLREIAASLPQERVLIETDAPYLAPEPHRSRLNQPALVVHTAECLANLWRISPTEVAQITTANARRLFTRLPNL